MSLFALIYTFVVAYICVVEGQLSCKTPTGDDGLCKPIYSCPSLLALISPKVTSEDTELLTKSKCGFQGDIPMVCCPDPCYTPDGQPGKCVKINSCKHLTDMLKPPASKDNLTYVRNSRCIEEDEHSVCCGPPKDSLPPVQPGDCKNTVSAFPPEPSTECCGVQLSAHKIIGGNYTDIDEDPWVLLIEYIKLNTTTTKLLCGGALISRRYALTSAHCVSGSILTYGTPKNVRLGEYNIRQDGKDCFPVESGEDCTDGAISIPIEYIIPHPDYKSNDAREKNDIALIRLKHMAPFTDFIRPICLPTVDITLEAPNNVRLHTIGWSSGKSDVKNIRYLPFVKMEDCQNAYKTSRLNTSLWKGQICAGGEARSGTCVGDAGGPLIYENDRHFEIIGLVSFGPKKCALKGVPTIYTNIYEYNTWIRNNIIP